METTISTVNKSCVFEVLTETYKLGESLGHMNHLMQHALLGFKEFTVEGNALSEEDFESINVFNEAISGLKGKLKSVDAINSLGWPFDNSEEFVTSINLIHQFALKGFKKMADGQQQDVDCLIFARHLIDSAEEDFLQNRSSKRGDDAEFKKMVSTRYTV